MNHTYQQACDEALEQMLGSLDKEHELAEFIRRFYDNLTLEELQAMPDDVAINLGRLVHTQMHKRDAGDVQITLETPKFLKKHYGRTRLTVTVINDDMPFLVDSLSNALNAMGFTMYRTVHPQLWVTRDAKGVLKELHKQETEGAQCESCVYFEVSPLPEGLDEEELASQLKDVLAHIRYAVEDWLVMTAKASEANTHIASVHKFLPRAELHEASDFFTWLLDKNFIFLGYAEYDFYDASDKEGFFLVDDSALGIFKVDEDSVQRHALANLPEEVQQAARQPNPINITKSNRRSLIHRDVLMDYIGVKRFDATGKVIGESRFLGLFTSNVYYQKTEDIPYIRRKVQQVMEAAQFDSTGHSGKSLQATLEFFPRDELFQIEFEDLFTMSLGIIALEERPDIRAFFRTDKFERFMSCFVFMPRDKFNTFVRKEIAKVLEKHLGGKITTFYSQLTDSTLARVNYIVQTTPGNIPTIDEEELVEELRFITNFWVDSLREAMLDIVGEKKAERLYREFGHAFPKNYINVTQIPHAVADTQRLKAVAGSGDPQFHIFESRSTNRLHLKMYALDTEVALTDILPIIENIGFKVRDVQPHRINPVIKEKEVALILRDFNLIPLEGYEVSFKTVKPLIEELLSDVWAARVENDGLNALASLAALTSRQIMMLRAYQRYARQAGVSYSHDYIIVTLTKHATLSAKLVALFECRFDPDYKGPRAKDEAAIYKDISDALLSVDNLAEDRIIRYFAEAMRATLRTNYYQGKEYLSFKFDSAKIPNLPLPHPFREIFVYSMHTEGIHLRGGKVARGGLRWSDRHEDFRTEVLGLMKAQVVKNTVIVPTGSKGGFVVKGASYSGDREAWQKTGIISYKQFLSGLLDITDNRVGADIVPPEKVVRYDEDDPYLVVAADKGTATFSDIANGVAQDYDFWLDDAFASGGSVGYDHKKMGITARGAWVSVERHFLEQGKDIQKEDFTVAGIGDMSGDVFGNGMLLSKHIKLVAAFNHLHIFLDPTPDAAQSFKERQRLFKVARGSWDTYDSKLISKGGGVFERSAKSITLTKEMQTMLETDEKTLTPNQVICLILKMQVELLWNGGIGTYVKATSESHDEVGDPSNNNTRINGDELRARVVGEGGNLGFTQLGRIEYAHTGGRLNTDAIDNSAGVDCSDHEVNIKIALRAHMESSKMDMEARNELLADMTDEVAALVLRDGDDNVNRANPTQEATRVTVVVDGRPNIEIRGPLQVATGEVATLTATAPEGSTFLWTMPNGDNISAESVDITTLSAGSTKVELRVELPTGDISDLTYPLEITDP